MACNEVNASLTSSLNTHGDGAIPLAAAFNNSANQKFLNVPLNLGSNPIQLVASLTSSIEASFRGELTNFYDTESLVHTYLLNASLDNPVPLEVCGFYPLT